MLTWEILNIRDVREEEYREWFSRMSAEKQERVRRLCVADDQKRSIAGDALARRMLCAYTGAAPDTLVIDIAENGKPYAKGLPVYFSISHAGDYAVCAVDKAPVGIDIEREREVLPRAVEAACTEEELQEITNAESASARHRFFELWTRKEAVYKRGGDDCVITYPPVPHGYVLCIAHEGNAPR